MKIRFQDAGRELPRSPKRWQAWHANASFARSRNRTFHEEQTTAQTTPAMAAGGESRQPEAFIPNIIRNGRNAVAFNQAGIREINCYPV